ncbi:hypothetical protein PH210_03260 [Paenibacillus sp. BSR1-1]|uniref:hypothetical protein n=1 Tax=Paenibacillus sp. BSR1-1 TaxID=3020845 RepID=UPI0025B18A88|nr:hypothetical protein [Paenibacillus sp. BSR1-1]MDN3015225.1 hypothetical protein [Paenibacillus sp. BSR1-1]
MMIKEKQVSQAFFQFILPFSWKAVTIRNFILFLQENQFTPYRLNELQNESAYYGGCQVSHSDMEAFFHPLTTQFLFPKSGHEKGLQRYSKEINIESLLNIDHLKIPFQIHSFDLILCPYELGFITVRTEIKGAALSNVIEFANQFNKKDFEDLLPDLESFVDWDSPPPFLEPDKMHIQSLLHFADGESIDEIDLFRSATLSGENEGNHEYITNYVKDHSYSRWAPNTYICVNEHCFSCLINSSTPKIMAVAKRFYGEYYYLHLINLFNKLVFVKIAQNYSTIRIEKDYNEIEKLIYFINSFTSNFFFIEYPINSEGQELFKLFKSAYNIDTLYSNTKDTLFSLFKYEENSVTKKDSMLLLVLTLYTVICGIFSMNLFAKDLEGKIHWSHFKSYNPFEYFAVFIVFSGIIVVAILGFQSLFQVIQERKNKKKWDEQAVISSQVPKKSN